MLAAVVGVGIGRRLHQKAAAVSTPQTNPNLFVTGDSVSAKAQAIAAKVDPGLVDINTKLAYQGAQAAGTGMVLTSSGEVLTNNHVIDGATSITATIVGTGRTYTAKVVGTDPTEDIAVLQLQGASGLKTIKTGNSSQVAVGDQVVAIGNAGGVGGAPSVVTGSVTAVGQTITASDVGGANAEQLTDLIETDAPIQAGDSGGPLVNQSGEVIGMDTAASSGRRFDAGQTVGFAIPISRAVTIAQQIESGQSSATVQIGNRGFLGVELQSGSSSSGAVLGGVASGSPAEAAGLAAGDTITSVDGKPVDSAQTLTTLLHAHRPGDKVTIVWSDQAGSSHTATVTLTTGPAD